MKNNAHLGSYGGCLDVSINKAVFYSRRIVWPHAPSVLLCYCCYLFTQQQRNRDNEQKIMQEKLL